MRLVMGDIHGELHKLRDLLNVTKDAEEYIFLGDYIDKGDYSFEVVDFLIKFSTTNKCVFLIGNHEYVWLKYLFEDERTRKDFLLHHGSRKFASSYLKAKLSESEFNDLLDEPRKLIEAIPDDHLKFYLNLLPWYIPKDTNLFCVHAGVDPDYEHLGMKKHPLERYLFVRKSFIYSKNRFFGKNVIFGHTACKFPYLDDYKIGIDTGAVYKGYGILSAYEIDTDCIIQHTGNIIQKKSLLKMNEILNPFDEVLNTH